MVAHRLPTLISAAHFHQEAGLHPDPRTIPEHHLQIEIVTQGYGEVFYKGEWLKIEPGCLLWLMPGDQTIGRSNFKNPYRCLSLYFNYPGIHHRAAAHLTQWLELDQLRLFTKEIVRLFVDETFDRSVLSQYAFTRSLYQATLNSHQNYDNRFPSGLRKALKFIDSNLSQNIKAKDIASAAEWSMPHLSDMFKKHLDESPHQTLLKRRIRAARERLSSTNDPIKRIAIECGFSNAAAFCHSFKMRTGETPNTYRKRQMQR